jgi:hypothetical protein
MELVGHSRTLRLTGLTSHQLREWTTRRGLVHPDQAPKGPGSRTSFSWRSVLQLRLLATMHQHFGVGLEESRPVMSALRTQLSGRSFVTLWGRLVVIDEIRNVSLADTPPIGAAALTLPLDPHLEIIAASFASLSESQRQLPLFAALPASAA